MPCKHTLHELNSGKQIGDLGGGERGEPHVRTGRADENVPWEEGLEVDEGEGVGGCEEDLVVG